MIKHIYANGPYLTVEASEQSYNAPYINMSNTSAGMVRYNNNQFEVYDGNVWHNIGGNGQAMVTMTSNAVSAIMWAENKMYDELRLKRLAEKHPAVADAIAHLREAEDRLQVVATLVEEEQKS